MDHSEVPQHRDRRLPTDDILRKFSTIIETSEWRNLECIFAAAQTIYIIGNGGNLAIAQHASSDMCRLTDKTAIAPSNAALALSLVMEQGYVNWLSRWLEIKVRAMSPADRKRTLLLGLSASGKSANIFRAIEKAAELGVPTGLICGVPPGEIEVTVPCIVLCTKFYHSTEALTMLLMYQLITSASFSCPSL